MKFEAEEIKKIFPSPNVLLTKKVHLCCLKWSLGVRVSFQVVGDITKATKLLAKLFEIENTQRNY